MSLFKPLLIASSLILLLNACIQLGLWHYDGSGDGDLQSSMFGGGNRCLQALMAGNCFLILLSLVVLAGAVSGLLFCVVITGYANTLMAVYFLGLTIGSIAELIQFVSTELFQSIAPEIRHQLIEPFNKTIGLSFLDLFLLQVNMYLLLMFAKRDINYKPPSALKKVNCMCCCV